MRVMSITHQNLNNRPCVQSNQPNFKGYIPIKSPITLLDSLFAADSKEMAAVKIFEKLVEHCTDLVTIVWLKEVPKIEADASKVKLQSRAKNKVASKADPKKSLSEETKPNLRIECRNHHSDITGDINVFDAYLDPKKSIDQNVAVLMQRLIDTIPEHIDWIKIVNRFGRR